MIARWFLILIGCLASACAGGYGGAPGELNVQPPPVSGEVKLSFIKMIGLSSGLRSPAGLSLAIDGTLYVCDPGNSSIIRLDPYRGELSRYEGGLSRSGRLFSPVDVSATDGLTVYAVDASGSRLFRFDRNLRNAYPVLDAELDGGGLFGAFNGLAYDRSTGDIYLTDADAGGVIRIDSFGRDFQSMGYFGSGERSMNQPAGIAVSLDGIVYIADPAAGNIVRMSRSGSDIVYLGEGVLVNPVDVAIIENTGIAVADRDGVVILSDEGVALGVTGFGTDRLMAPRAVEFGGGSLYVSDGLSGVVLVYGVEQ